MSSTNNLDSDFVPYPEIDDKDFYQTIYKKAEFYDTRYTPEYFKIDPTKVCNPTQFNLQPHQIFVRNYLSPDTPYNGLLLYHGTGSGKTCSAVQIAEGMKDIIHKMGKKIYIIAKSHIQSNFWKELYNPDKEQMESIPGSMQCTGTNYYIPKELEPNPIKRERMIKKTIKEYYEFFGLRSFANYVDMEVKRTKSIDEVFSNSLIIIDEAHGLTGEGKFKEFSTKSLKANIGASAKILIGEYVDKIGTIIDYDNTTKKYIVRIDDTNIMYKPSQVMVLASSSSQTRRISTRGILDVLHDILKNANDVKLVLMTATPMKDTANDIVDLINLLRLNNRQPLINEDKLFLDDRTIDRNYLIQMTRGYISYLKGENPITFPRILEPVHLDLYIPRPRFNELGQPIDPKDWVKDIKLIRCPMSLFQYYNFRRQIATTGKRKNIDQLGRRISNIVYPVNPDDLSFGGDGNSGLEQALIKHLPKRIKIGEVATASGKQKAVYNTKPLQFEYREFNYGFLSRDKVGRYSAKFATYLDNLIKSKGITYTYTEWLGIGIIPIALMLEANGYRRYRSANSSVASQDLLQLREQDRIYRCAVCGKLRRNPIHQKSSSDYHSFIQARYMLFTGDKHLSPSHLIDDELKIANSEQNKDGHIIKHIIGNLVSAEGIDYKRLREVHIIEGWHNNTRLHQVIGRASRHCSHIDLPPSERNVTVFYYSASLPPVPETISFPPDDQLMSIIPPPIRQQIANNDLDKQLIETAKAYPLTWKELQMETPDEKIYRRIEFKHSLIKQVAGVLRQVAVDCPFNRLANIQSGDPDYQCLAVDPSKPPKLNYDTYNLYFSQPQIEQAMKIIIELYQLHHVFKLEYLVKLVKERDSKLIDKYIYEALNILLGHPPEIEPIPLIDQFGRTGHIIYKNPYYLFQPSFLEDESANLYYRTHPLKIKKKYTNLDILIEQEKEQLRKQVKAKAKTKVRIRIKPRVKARLKGTRLKEPTSEPTVVEVEVDKELLDLVQKLEKMNDRFMVEYTVDRLSPQMQQKLYEYPNPSPQLQKWLNSLFFRRGKFYLNQLDENSTQKISPHRIAGTPRLFKDGQWVDASESQAEIRQLLNLYQPPVRTQSSIAGVIDYNRKGQPVFKIFNETTGANVRDKRKKARGRVCTTYNASELDKFLMMFNQSTTGTKTSKCKRLELMFRKLDAESPDKQYFWIIEPSKKS